MLIIGWRVIDLSNLLWKASHRPHPGRRRITKIISAAFILIATTIVSIVQTIDNACLEGPPRDHGAILGDLRRLATLIGVLAAGGTKHIIYLSM